MKLNAMYYENRRDEYPFEVWYYTEKQKTKKYKYFQTIEQVQAWCKNHKTARIEAGSWQVFAIMDAISECDEYKKD